MKNGMITEQKLNKLKILKEKDSQFGCIFNFLI